MATNQVIFSFIGEKIVMLARKTVIITEWGKICSGLGWGDPRILNTESECRLMASEMHKQFTKPGDHFVVRFRASQNRPDRPCGCYLDDYLNVFWNTNDGRAFKGAKSICRMYWSK